MSIPQIIIDDINAGLGGKTTPGIQRGEGSFLTVDFNAADNLAAGDGDGRWSLWVYMADWRIEVDRQIVTGSADLGQQIDQVLQDLGPITTGGLAMNEAGDTFLSFSGNITLKIFATALDEDDSEAWLLYQPDGSTVGAGPASRWSMESSGS